MSKPEISLRRPIYRALTLLEKHQGVKAWPGPGDPLDCLVLTLLSQSTNDALRDQAYRRLRQRFPTWQQVLEAPLKQIIAAIRVAGLAQQKAPRLQALLSWIKAHFGSLSLEGLKSLDDDGAMALLTSQKGIGVKTAAVVLMASLGRDLCPVDTHVHRIAGRLGWVSANMSAEKTFEALRPHVPRGRGYSLHMNLLQFGRTICRARQPLCGVCFLYDECRWEEKAKYHAKGVQSS